MPNLKVNSKSSMLEFKRKHNKLVDSVGKVINVTNIRAISTDELNSLKCGDTVLKEDETGKHAYIVTYKKDNVGICLSYFDGSGYLETVSYDYTGGNWVYNSTDVFNGGQKADKITLDSIIYEEDVIKLPDFVLPLMIVVEGSNVYYVDYSNGQLTDEDGHLVSVDVLRASNSKHYSLDTSIDHLGEITDLIYMSFDSHNYEPDFNTYFIFHPLTESGTKLYKHNLAISGNDVTTLSIELVSKSSSKITNILNILSLPDMNNINMPIIRGNNLYGFILKVAFAGMGSNVTYVLFNSDGTITYNTATYTSISSEDTVTPL